MDPSSSLPLCQTLVLPRPGESVRVLLGTSEVVLEHVRGGYALLWTDGRQARRYSLGLGDGRLSLQLKAPRLPLRVVPRDVVAVVPDARLSGYLQVPLVPTLTWQPSRGELLTLIELPPADLQAEWDEVAGSWFRSPSSVHVRFPMRLGEPKAVVPLRLRNDSGGLLSPDFVPVTVRDDDLRECRGSIVVAPLRLSWNGEQFVRSQRGDSREAAR